MLESALTRRRAIAILAGTAAGGLLPGLARPAAADFVWHGTAMGADAHIVFSDGDEARAQAAAMRVTDEIDRLEDALSLFRPNSEICRLNRHRRLAGPSGDLRGCLALAVEMARATRGLFDPTVQVLWECYVDHRARAGRTGPPPDLPERLALVDWRRVETGADLVRLGDGQRITLNGLGQGYVTDRVAALLRHLGYEYVLVSLGEQRALGPRADGEPWRVSRPGGVSIPLWEGSLATSEGAACMIDPATGVHHLFDPRSGTSPSIWRRMTVQHASAAVADALSTAFYAARPAEIELALRSFAGARVWATVADGREWRAGAR